LNAPRPLLRRIGIRKASPARLLACRFLRRTGLLLGLALLLPTTPTLAAGLGAGQPVTIPHARQYDLASPQTGQRYRIFVSAPSTPPPPAGYPVIYVLDGNAAFPLAAHISRNIERRQPVTGIAPALVVGIGYAGNDDYHMAARSHDYTLAAGRYDPASGGGAEGFLDFIEQDLKPRIAATFTVNRKKQAIFGHSYGGLFVLHTLFTRPEAFSTYIAASPSIWWQDKHVLDEMRAFLASRGEQQPWPTVQISVGATEDEPPKGRLSPELLAMRAKRPMVAEARQLTATLQSHPASAGRVSYHELAGENHGSAWPPALSRGFDLFLE